MPPVTTFAEARSRLQTFAPANLPRHAYTLEHIQRFMHFIGNPQDRVRVVHVTGTSGKTSTCYYIASLLHESGLRVGLSVSPYVHEVNERVQIGMRPLPEAQFCSELEQFLALVKDSGIQLTMFEIMAAFAYWEFARQGVEYAVVEVGMGGELDATNVAQATGKFCVITDIGMDHQKQLGNSPAEIAQKKAGIIHLNNTVILRAQAPEVIEVVRQRARQMHADLTIVTDTSVGVVTRHLPKFQQRNFTMAYAAVQRLAQRDQLQPINDDILHAAVHTKIPGRMEIFIVDGKAIVIDGAHNAQKLDALLDSVRTRYPDKDVAVVFASKEGANERNEQTLHVLAKQVSHIICTTFGGEQPGTPHGVDPQVLAALCKASGVHSVEAVQTPKAAWRKLTARPERVLLITGSLYMLSDYYSFLGHHADR